MKTEPTLLDLNGKEELWAFWVPCQPSRVIHLKRRSEHWVDFWVYEVQLTDGHKPEFIDYAAKSRPGPGARGGPETFAVYWSGHFKWDGCSEIEPGQNGHSCSRTEQEILLLSVLDARELSTKHFGVPLETEEE